MSVSREGEVLCSGKGGKAARNEQEARVPRLEQQRCEDRCHDLRPDGVDVPGLVPHLAHRHVP